MLKRPQGSCQQRVTGTLDDYKNKNRGMVLWMIGEGRIKFALLVGKRV